MSTALLTVSPSPHIHTELTVPQIMRGVIIAMVPALLFSIYNFGLGAVYVTVLAIVFCVGIEYLIAKYLLNRAATIYDGSAVITGILLAFNVPSNLPWYIILGLLAGASSVYYSRMYPLIEGFLKPKKKNVYRKAVLGGLVLAVLILFFPSLFGEGYESIKMLSDLEPEKLFEHSILSNLIINKWILVLLILAAMFLKTIAAAITMGSGGNGGNFAPSLFVGAYMGFAFATLINLIGITTLPVSNFTLVAMAGILTGVFHAPLTGIFLIAEITGGYELMIPLMLVSAISFIVVKYFEPHSMDTKALAKKGHIITSDKDKNILASMKSTRVVETDFQKIAPDATLGELAEVVAHSKRNIFPVVENEMLVGVILLDSIREIMFKHEMYHKVFVKQLMSKPPAIVAPGEDMQSIMKKFDETKAWNLPVVSSGRYVGFISKSSIFNQYRTELIKSTKE